MTTDIDTLATALHVKTDDLLRAAPHLAPWRPKIGIAPTLTDAELVTLAVMQALLSHTSEARLLRYARLHPGHLFRYLPQQPGYDKRLRAAANLIKTGIRVPVTDTTLWTDDVWVVDVWVVDVWVVDSTPVECGRSKQTVRRSDLAGWAEYGYCASHSRYFSGLRLHLVCTPGGLPAGFAPTGAKADERQTLLGIFTSDPALAADRPGQTLIGDRNHFGKDFEQNLVEAGVDLLRPARKGEDERPGARLFTPLRQTIESINQTFKGAARPGTPRWTHPGRGDGPRPVTRTRSDRRDLAQRQDRTTGHAFVSRLRSLTPWNQPSSALTTNVHRVGGTPGKVLDHALC